MDEMNRWIWLAIFVPIQNISGGTLTYKMLVYSFVGDNSTPRYIELLAFFYPQKYKSTLYRERMIRIGVLDIVSNIGLIASLPLGAYLYEHGSYICVFSTSVLFYVLACLAGLGRLLNYQEKIKSAELRLKGI